MRRVSLVVAGFAGVTVAISSANADVLQFDFAGTLTSIPSPLGGDFTLGDAFAVSYIVDSAAPPFAGALTSGPGFADYAMTSWSGAVAGFSGSAPTGMIRMSNDNVIDAYDAFPFAPVTVAGVPAGFTFLGADVRFWDFSAAALPDTSLVVDPVVLMGMPTRQFVLSFFHIDSQTTYQAIGPISSATVTVVPGPGAAWMLVGLTPLLRRRRS